MYAILLQNLLYISFTTSLISKKATLKLLLIKIH